MGIERQTLRRPGVDPQAGQQQTHLKLFWPGEAIRTPRILLVGKEWTPCVGTTFWAPLVAHYVPRIWPGGHAAADTEYVGGVQRRK